MTSYNSSWFFLVTKLIERRYYTIYIVAYTFLEYIIVEYSTSTQELDVRESLLLNFEV
jgi:hypothetical protein